MANQYRSVLAGAAGTGGDAVAADVLSGKTFTNDNGPDTGTMPNRGAVTQALNAGESYTIPEGYHNGSGTVTANAQTIQNTVKVSSAASYIITLTAVEDCEITYDGNTVSLTTGQTTTINTNTTAKNLVITKV